MSKNIDHYNKFAIEYSQKWQHSDMLEHYKRFLNLLKGDKILELGCGSGRDAKYFSENGINVLATDASVKLLEIAMQNAPRARFLELDFSSSFNLQRSFDGIWACASLVHLSKEELRFAFESIKQHMNKLSVFFLTLKECDFKEDKNRTFTYWQDPGVKDLLTAHNLEVLHSQTDSTENSKWLTYYVKLASEK